MSIEASVVNDSELERLLKKAYSFNKIDRISLIDGGSANCRIIHAHGEKYVLKELPSNYTVEDVVFEPELSNYLSSKEFPAAVFIKAQNGCYVWEYKHRAFHLQQYIKGHTYERNEAPEWFMAESALLLGKMHFLLMEYPKLIDGMGMEYFNSWNYEKVKRSYEEFQKELNKEKDPKRRSSIQEDITFKLSRLEKVDRLSREFNNLTYMNSHGDYKIYQLICSASKISGIIDFSLACVHPIVWEIIRSYVHADPYCINGEIKVENLKKYIMDYCTYGELTKHDLKMMPQLFYFQQMYSNYYGEYLNCQPSHKEEAYQTASWSVKLCRWLDGNMEELSKELNSIDLTNKK